MISLDNDQIDDVYNASPGWWDIINKLEDIKIQNDDLEFEIMYQCCNLKNLGINYLNQYDTLEIPKTIMQNFLTYIDSHYINFLDFIQIDYDKIKVLTKSIYEILFVDFITQTLPQICVVNKIQDPVQLVQESEEYIRKLLITHYNNVLQQLNSLYKINPSLSTEMVKNSFAIDLFSKNLDKFNEQFIIPVIINYSNQIRENF